MKDESWHEEMSIRVMNTMTQNGRPQSSGTCGQSLLKACIGIAT